MLITSRQNALIKSIRKALRAGDPLDNGAIVCEGPHLAEEALRGTWTTERIFTTAAHSHLYPAHITTVLAPELIHAISATEHCQEVIALVHPKAWTGADFPATAPIVYLDGIQDPGNAGTIVRSAEAFAAAGVVFSPQTVRIANGKFLRATAGSIFRLPFFQNAPPPDRPLFWLDAAGHLSIEEVNLNGATLAVGNEGSGVSPKVRAMGRSVRIPAQRVESLNAAVACSIALYTAKSRPK